MNPNAKNPKGGSDNLKDQAAGPAERALLGVGFLAMAKLGLFILCYIVIFGTLFYFAQR